MDLKSGFPFWPLYDGLIRAYPRLAVDAHCDVAIVGAGITGALIANELSRAGFDTLVVDRRDAAWGSTAASTALLQYEIDVPLVDLAKMIGMHDATRAYLACRDAVRKLGCLAAEIAGTFGFEHKKSLYLARLESDRTVLRAELELRRQVGIRVDWLDERDLAERFAFRRPAALLSYDAAQVDAYAFTHALLRDAGDRGCRVFDRTSVEHFNVSESGVSLVTADGPVVRARHLVVAAGYETRELLPHVPARLVSTFALASEPLDALDGWGEDECVIWERARPYLYLRTTADHRVIMGGEDEPFANPEDRDRALPRKTEVLVRRFRELFPAIPLEVAFSWAGTFGEAEDGLAYIGRHREWPSTHFALGYGGNGITYGLIAAEIIRDELLGRHNPNAELFRFDR